LNICRQNGHKAKNVQNAESTHLPGRWIPAFAGYVFSRAKSLRGTAILAVRRMGCRPMVRKLAAKTLTTLTTYPLPAGPPLLPQSTRSHSKKARNSRFEAIKRGIFGLFSLTLSDVSL
jgi:hypothetical protein